MPLENSLIETKFEIKLRIEWPHRFRQQPLGPIGVLLANLLYFRTSTPPWPMIIPFHLDLADVAERAATRDLLCGLRIGLAAMLRAHLNNGLGLQHGVARGFRFVQNVAHRLLDIRVFARFNRHFENGRMRVFGGRDQNRVNIFQRQNFFDMLHGPRSSAVVSGIRGEGLLAISYPQVANRGHLDVVARLELRGDQIEIAAPTAAADMSKRNTIVSAKHASVGQSGAGQNGASSESGGRFFQKVATVHGR